MPYAVIACSIMFFWIISLRAYLFTVLPTIAADLGLSPSAAGALIGLTALSYCLVVWAAGFLPGRRKRVIQIGTFVSLLAMAGVALAPGAVGLYGAAILAGAGSGVYLPLGLAIVVEASRHGQRSRNMSVHELMAAGGYFGGAGFVALALPALSWREATLAWTLVGVAAWLALLFLRDEGSARRPEGGRAPLPLDGLLLASAVIFGTCQLLLAGLISVLPLLLVEGWTVPQAEAAAVVSWSRLAGVIGILIVGATGDRWRPETVARGFFLLALASTLAMVLLPYGLPFVGAIFVLSAAASGAVVLVSVVVAQAFSPDLRARALSVTSGASGIVGLAVLPAVFGAFIDFGLVAAPFVVSAIASLAAAILVGRVGRRSVSDVAPASTSKAPAQPH
jgi:MFS transporter, DHA1 family, inner membrane transport protein